MHDDKSQDNFVADPDMRSTPKRALPPRARWSTAKALAAVGLAALLAAGGWLAWTSTQAPEPGSSAGSPALAPPVPVAVPTAPAAGSAASTPAAELGVAETTAPAASAAGLPALDESDLVLARWLEEVFDREGMALLRINDLARRLVATVDNLGRERASARLWPVGPTPGRFATAQRGQRTVIDADNSLRYAPLVIALEAVDPARLATVYRRAYPLLQQAYAELGYPGQSFHARLLTVIDILLATPEPADEIEVLPLAVSGRADLSQAWRHHTFADPMLEQMSAGQKLLLRVGPVNQRRLKLLLLRLRAALLAPDPPR